MAITILTEAELRRCVLLDLEVVETIERAFTAFAAGRAIMPPILHLAMPEANGEIDIKTAYVAGLESFAIKVSPGFFDNPKLGLPSLSGLMILLSARTGRLEALHLDNGYLTDVRTAAAGAVAARHLAREDASIAGVLGAGVQARLQMEALALVRPIARVLVWAREVDKARAYAADMRPKLGMDVIAVASAEEVVRGCEVLVTATAAREPIVQAPWLHPGLHITAVGADAPYKNELDPQVLRRADVVVCDRRAQCEVLGELHHALLAGYEPAILELGEITSGRVRGRLDPDQVTVADLTGTGLQDTAVALLAYGKARAAGAGIAIET